MPKKKQRKAPKAIKRVEKSLASNEDKNVDGVEEHATSSTNDHSEKGVIAGVGGLDNITKENRPKNNGNMNGGTSIIQKNDRNNSPTSSSSNMGPPSTSSNNTTLAAPAQPFTPPVTHGPTETPKSTNSLLCDPSDISTYSDKSPSHNPTQKLTNIRTQHRSFPLFSQCPLEDDTNAYHYYSLIKRKKFSDKAKYNFKRHWCLIAEVTKGIKEYTAAAAAGNDGDSSMRVKIQLKDKLGKEFECRFYTVRNGMELVVENVLGGNCPFLKEGSTVFILYPHRATFDGGKVEGLRVTDLNAFLHIDKTLSELLELNDRVNNSEPHICYTCKSHKFGPGAVFDVCPKCKMFYFCKKCSINNYTHAADCRILENYVWLRGVFLRDWENMLEGNRCFQFRMKG